MPPVPWSVAWRQAREQHGPHPSHAQIAAFHIDGTGDPLTETETELLRLHWLAFARIPTRRFLASLPAKLHTLSITQLSRHYPHHSAKHLTATTAHTKVDAFVDAHGACPRLTKDCIDSILVMRQVRCVYVTRARDTVFSDSRVRRMDGAHTSAVGAVLAARPAAAAALIVSIVPPAPARIFHPRLLLLLRALEGRAPRVAARAAGAALFRPGHLGSGRRAARFLMGSPAATFEQVWRAQDGEIIDAHHPPLLHASLASRVLQPHDAGAAEEGDIPVDDIESEDEVEPTLLPSVESLFQVLRMVFPFASGLCVDAALRHGALEAAAGGAARVFRADAPGGVAAAPGDVWILADHSRNARQSSWGARHVVVMGEKQEDADTWAAGGRISMFVRRAPLRISILHIQDAPEWKWRGWLFPHYLEGWLRALPEIRKIPDARVAQTHAVQQAVPGHGALPLLSEFVACTPGAVLTTEFTRLSFLYAPAWAALPDVCDAAWILVDENIDAAPPGRAARHGVRAARRARRCWGRPCRRRRRAAAARRRRRGRRAVLSLPLWKAS